MILADLDIALHRLANTEIARTGARPHAWNILVPIAATPLKGYTEMPNRKGTALAGRGIWMVGVIRFTRLNTHLVDSHDAT